MEDEAQLCIDELLAENGESVLAANIIVALPRNKSGSRVFQI
jgi:hypothetical protein